MFNPQDISIYWVVAYVLALHYLVDFIMQPDWMAKGKSRDNLILAEHCAKYSSVMALGVFWLCYNIPGLLFFVLLLGLIHFLTDWVTSRWSSYYFKKGYTHLGFVVIGFDQWLHLCQLLGLIWLIRH